jgi:transketolase
MGMATRDTYGKTLAKLGASDESIVVLDADLSGSTRTSFFNKVFPERFFNMGIAEQNMMGVAAGLSLTGKTVFASTFAMFATGRPWEQIRNSICYPKLNVKIAATHAGLTVGEDGASHQAIEDIALMRVLPNMTVFVPADAYEVESIITYLVGVKGAAYVRMSRSATPLVYKENSVDFKPGKADVLHEGDDCAVFACGIMVAMAVEAAAILLTDGIGIRVINMSSIKPIDKNQIVESAKKCGKAISVEEHSCIGGMGSAVNDILSKYYPIINKCIGVNDQFGESGTPQAILDKHELTVERIVKEVKALVAG